MVSLYDGETEAQRKEEFPKAPEAYLWGSLFSLGEIS